jgi:hypothetical protein
MVDILSIQKILKHQIWTYLGSKSYGLRLIEIYSRLFKKSYCVISDDTDIVVEGYPRSANTYVSALLIVQNGDRIKIGRHIHGSAQLLKGIKQSIPSLLLIRNPVDAISSLIMRAPYLPPRLLLNNYISFHTQLLDWVDELIIIDFYDATNNMDKVIEYINAKYEIKLATQNIDNLKESVNTKIDELDMLDRKDHKVNHHTVGRPNKERKVKSKMIKKLIEEEHKQKLIQCYELYNHFMKKRLCMT